MKINFEDLKNLKDIQLIDVREENSFVCGHIFGAKNLPNISFEMLNKTKTYCLYCDDETKSKQLCENFESNGIKCFYLEGGYHQFLKEHLFEYDGGEKSKNVEKSLQKKFRKSILSKFLKAIKEYEMISENDKIAVCISGGKDSLLMAKLFQELLRFSDVKFTVEFLVMNPGYNKANRKMIEDNARLMNIPLHIFETNIFESVTKIEKSPCYICARMRRGFLYSEAKKLGCNKIALGHHFDDVIETSLMAMLFGGQVQTMVPKLHSSNFEGMELIRPMYYVREEDIIHWRDYNDLHFLQCACKFTEMCYGENCADIMMESKRKKVKELIKSLKISDPQVDNNIFKSMQNVNLSTIIDYKDKQGVKHKFLDEYEKIYEEKD